MQYTKQCFIRFRETTKAEQCIFDILLVSLVSIFENPFRKMALIVVQPWSWSRDLHARWTDLRGNIVYL